LTGKEEQVSAGPVGGTTVNMWIRDWRRGKSRCTERHTRWCGSSVWIGENNQVIETEYFTYAGQVQAKGEKIGEKLGDSERPKLLKGLTEWKTQPSRSSIDIRKAITGVAAGPVELEMIRRTFPNADMSKTEFESAVIGTATNTWKMLSVDAGVVGRYI